MPVCVARHLNHVCLAVRDIEETMRFYREVFGVGPSEAVEIADQGVRAALVRVGGSQLEFIEPTDPDSAVARFIEKRGEGVHHLCFEVDDLAESLRSLESSGARVIDRQPREGLSGSVGFIHPSATNGVLIELVEQSGAKR